MINYSDEDLRKIDKFFSEKKIYRYDLVNIFFCFLADIPYFANTRRFSLGLLSYIPAIIFKRWKSRKILTTSAIQEEFDYLFCILGDVSKEQATLIPVISSLRQRDQKVLVLWLRTTPAPNDILTELDGSTVFIPPDNVEIAGSLSGFLRDLLCSVLILLKGCYHLRNLAGWCTAFNPKGARLFEQLLYLQRWERYFFKIFSNQDFKGVAFVSETAASTQAICHVALDHQWPSHHYLHGLPGLVHTRSLSDHIYCFSSADRNYFLRNGWHESRVHANGHPRQCHFAEKICQLRTMKPEDGGLRILFASQPSIDGMGFHDDEYTKIHVAVIEATKHFDFSEENIRIRLHPIENDHRFLEIAAQHSLANAQSLLSRNSIEEDFAWANVVLTVASTISIETAYSGCALIWLRFGKFHYVVREELCDAEYGLSVSTCEQLIHELTRLQSSEYRHDQIMKLLDAARKLSIIVPCHGTIIYL